ncbi:radical SAM protein [Candidatus Woesearchaeota archaeon]|nr:radical SAM protein [Candidatus Woesearchaeota archaeon]
MQVLKTGFHSWCAGQLAEGCKRCVQGRKLVLFITGLCGQRCFYCPVGEKKFGHDTVYANEWKLGHADDPKELLEEARLTEATGAGITGGDPLVKVERCCEYIRLLKREFGKDFHIHLYTPLRLVTEERLKALHDAGLDEIRFHPDLDDRTLWPRLDLAKRFDWTVGVEIPAVPGYARQIKEVIDFIAGKVSFINLNELELSDTAADHYKLDEMGFEPKDSASYGVKGSDVLGRRMLAYAQKKGLPAHFCTAKLKDLVQVKNRLKLRAESTALPFDVKTDEGTLLRGCVYLRGLEPGARTKERVAMVPEAERIRFLSELKARLADAGVPEEKIIIDVAHARLIIPRSVAQRERKLLRSHGVPALVEEYPTADALQVDVEFV